MPRRGTRQGLAGFPPAVPASVRRKGRQMSILNSLVTALTGGGAGGASKGGTLANIARVAMRNPQLLAVAAAMFTSANKHGGLTGMIDKFKQHGLGDVAQSWVGEGESKEVNADQIREVFGEQGIERIAQKSGATPQETPDLLASVLPGLVNMLTPGGRTPPQAEAPKSSEDVLTMLQNMLRGR
ncbi:YidB family protein [Falsigemmobacter intermedius]|uniref:YidB family protein n=1 Tax=Falsigemmobacter intermedius TaxID=1553448 RepID=UPI003F124D80